MRINSILAIVDKSLLNSGDIVQLSSSFLILVSILSEA